MGKASIVSGIRRQSLQNRLTVKSLLNVSAIEETDNDTFQGEVMADNAVQGEWSVSRRHELVREPLEIDLRLVGLLLLLSVAAAILRLPYAYSIDDLIYVEMARAFW